MPPSHKNMPASSSFSTSDSKHTTSTNTIHSNHFNTANSIGSPSVNITHSSKNPLSPSPSSSSAAGAKTQRSSTNNGHSGINHTFNTTRSNNNTTYTTKDNHRSSSSSSISISISQKSSTPATVTAASTGHIINHSGNYHQSRSRSDSEDSYAPGGGFISDMDEHDPAFDGAMEYEGEDGRSLLGDDFDASSDVATDVTDIRKEKRARDFQERLLKLELEFEDNKQTIFEYQMARYKEEMEAILNGVHPDFHDQLEDLAEVRDTTIANARLYRDYQFECAQQAYELETELAEEEYMTEREGLREKMLAAIDNKRRALRDDKENLDITNGAGQISILGDFALEPTSRTSTTRRLRKRGQDQEVGPKGSKRKTAAPPGAKWQTSDADALEDLGLIRKNLVSGPTKKTGAVKKK